MERGTFIGIPALKNLERREVHLRFRSNCGIHYHDLVERGTNPLTRRKNLVLLATGETSCIDMSIIRNAMADSIRINDRSL